MGLFATKTRNHLADRTGSGRELPERVRALLPRQFVAVGEALASGSDSLEACDHAGRRLAQDGAALEEVLDALRSTTQLVTGSDPSYDAVRAVGAAWSEATLAYLHQISCEDPLTGLASLAHLRARIADLYRSQARAGLEVQTSFGLVVVDLPNDRPGAGIVDDGYSRALRVARVGQSARTVFDGSETISRVGTNRVVAVVERDEQLCRRVALLRTLLDSASFPTRVWIEGLPGNDIGAGHLMDELARA